MFSIIYSRMVLSLLIWPWTISMLLHSLVLCSSLERTLIDSEVHCSGSAEVQVHWCIPLIGLSGTEIVSYRTQSHGKNCSSGLLYHRVEYFRKGSFRKSVVLERYADQYQLNTEASFVRDKHEKGESPIKKMLLHRRQFHWVRFWESVCQRSRLFLWARIWLTVVLSSSVKSSTALVREGLGGRKKTD